MIKSMKTSVTVCIKRWTIKDCATPHQWWEYLLYCSGVLPIDKVVSRFKKIGSFVEKLCKLGFKLENKSNHWPILNSAKFCVNTNSTEMGTVWLNNSWAWGKTVVPTLDLPRSDPDLLHSGHQLTFTETQNQAQSKLLLVNHTIRASLCHLI